MNAPAVSVRSVASPVFGRSRAADWAGAVRPAHWVKNLLLLAGPAFSGNLGEAAGVATALRAVLAFSLLSSAAYLFNDAWDAPWDRTHPSRRRRAVASGRISPTAARGSAMLLAAAGLAVSAGIGAPFLSLGIGYLILTGAYTLFLRRVPFLDAATVAAGHAIRALAGFAAAGAAPSGWLLLCVGCLAFFVVLAKRRHELLALGPTHRPSLSGYGRRSLDRLMLLSVAVALPAYGLCILPLGLGGGAGGGWLLATIPVAFAAVARYGWLVYGRSEGGEPARLLADPAMAASAFLYAGLILAGVAAGGFGAASGT